MVQQWRAPSSDSARKPIVTVSTNLIRAALITQAKDRSHRFGQENHVIATTLIALGTLDEHIQSVLRKKDLTLDAMKGGDHAVAMSPREGKADAASVLTTIVKDYLGRRQQREKAA